MRRRIEKNLSIRLCAPLSLGEGAGGEVSHARAHSECCGNGRKNGDDSLKDDFPSVVFHDDIFLRLIMKPHPQPLSRERGAAVEDWGEILLN